MAGAPRLLLRPRRATARGAWLALCLWCAVLVLTPAQSAARNACTQGDGAILAQTCFLADPPPPRRYGHDVLGDTAEWGTLTLDWGPEADVAYTDGAPSQVFRLDDGIFEDVAPRVIELGDDPMPEVLVVNSAHGRGARALIIDPNPDGVRSIAGPFIGTQNRWLAPLGAADLDGDGTVEIAWIDRPHLAKTLRIFRVSGTELVEVANLRGFTNHRIGEPDIAGGIRDCGNGPEMILATGNWFDLVAVRWTGSAFTQTVLGPDTTRPAFARAMDCK